MGKNNRPKNSFKQTKKAGNAVNLHSQSRPWNPSLQMQVKSVLFSFGTHVALFKHGSERQGSTKHKLRQQSETKKEEWIGQSTRARKSVIFLKLTCFSRRIFCVFLSQIENLRLLILVSTLSSLALLMSSCGVITCNRFWW